MRNSKLSAVGVLVVSVDLELPVDQWSTTERRALDEIAPQLVDLFDRLCIPATWAVADPLLSAATERLQASQIDHEIAVLGDTTWVGSQASRGRFAGELSRRVLRARAAGLATTTLVPVDPVDETHLDLLVKHGITAVRGPLQATAPQALRFGVWQLPATLRLPVESGWLHRAVRGLIVRSSLRRTAAGRGLFHLIVDGPRLGLAGRPALRSLERLLRYADSRRRQHQLEAITMSEAAARLSHTPSILPARSVLRKAA